jgi:cell division protein FtsI (penicillin-binding protein 3)
MRKQRRQNPEMRMLWDQDFTVENMKKSRKRAVILLTTVFFGFAVIFFRLVDLMIIDHDRLAQRASNQYMREKTLNPERGIIWDRQLREMATSMETDSLFVVPSKIEDTRGLSRRLANVTDFSYKELNMKFLSKKQRGFIWLKRKMDFDTARKVSSLREKYDYKELGFIREPKRFYPKGRTAAHILGFANIDSKGIAGIELLYEDYLRGEVSSVSIGRDARGNSLESGVNEALAGNNIILAIDEGIQHIVERELSAAMEEWNAKAAVAIMMNPVTGEILAMANRPTFDPNNPGQSRAESRRNRAITDIYEPGSTLKSILAAAALEERIVGLHDEFDVSKGFIVVGGKPVRDIHRNEILSFQEVIQRSSNVGAVQVGLKVGVEKYYSYIRKFGFGEKTGIDFPGEVRGILRRPEDWSGTSIAALSIGQEIGTTPLQVLRAYAAIANGGLLMKPYIVSEIISNKGEIVRSVTPTIERRVVSVETAETVKEILKTVVEVGGTAQRADVNGNLVAGKTGTAQIFDEKEGRYSKDRYVSSFVGFVPADDPKVALIVVIYEPTGKNYGGLVAAPVFKNIVEHTFAYLEVPMERDENRVFLVSK